MTNDRLFDLVASSSFRRTEAGLSSDIGNNFTQTIRHSVAVFTSISNSRSPIQINISQPTITTIKQIPSRTDNRITKNEHRESSDNNTRTKHSRTEQIKVNTTVHMWCRCAEPAPELTSKST